MSEIPEEPMRPHDRLLEFGAAVLTDRELIQVLCTPGGASVRVPSNVVADKVVTEFNVRRLYNVPPDELVAQAGRIRAAQLLAAAEIGRRSWPEGECVPLIRGPESIFEQTQDIRTMKREHFIGFYLNSRNQVLRREIISIGSLNASIVHPREVYLPAVALSAASVVLAHNHPSGDPTPSEEDLAITRRLMEAGRILGIDLLDHVVVAKDSYASFKERRLLRAA